MSTKPKLLISKNFLEFGIEAQILIENFLQGLLKEGFDESRILTVASLDEASAHIRDFVGRGDAVLFENDLPDNYKE